MFSSKNFHLEEKPFFFNLKEKFLRILIVSYGARVRGNVFKMEFRVLSRKFESIETSPGFAQFLGENWIQSHKKAIIRTMLEKIVSNDKSLEVNVVISHKKLNCSILNKKK